ncbi:hypothetical protein GC722_10805 [Auraticoccus sp. F435]|uniref:DUF4157 domain-containing protein n=1 Tax=Auraticoccus cholistanensis TaxID=2656650 RepID=A0A6A9V0Z3_9ACTN|nr:hypothetical protein [Auraticoccus cholistanensis]MVA76509.1 hypothetical protein [Auraticoccus cholistanensis]
MERRHRLREVGNWLNLSTPLGLAVARVGGARVGRGPRGLWLAGGYRPRFPFAAAFTVGNVIISRGRPEQLRGGLLDHEERHSWQWFALLGVFFLPAYLLATAWSWLRTGDRASANVFEVDAGLERGGYRRAPVRPLPDALSGGRRGRGAGRPRPGGGSPRG